MDKLPPLVTPFVAERFTPAHLPTCIVPPYDEISEQAHTALEGMDPYNIVRVILPRKEEGGHYSAAAQLALWREEQVLVQDVMPSVCIVRQMFVDERGKPRVCTGVIAVVAVEPYNNGRVIPHERLTNAREYDRLASLRETQTMCEALLMVTRDPHAILAEQLLLVAGAQVPTYTIYLEAAADLKPMRLDIWQVYAPESWLLLESMREGPLYIADGHHRYGAAQMYRCEKPNALHTLAWIVPAEDPGLSVVDTGLQQRVPVKNVLDLADRGVRLPAKQTYFTPKAPGGVALLRYG